MPMVVSSSQQCHSDYLLSDNLPPVCSIVPMDLIVASNSELRILPLMGWLVNILLLFSNHCRCSEVVVIRQDHECGHGMSKWITYNTNNAIIIVINNCRFASFRSPCL